MKRLALAALAAVMVPGVGMLSASATAPALLKPMNYVSSGSVRVGGKTIDYKAVVGTLIVHPKGYDDAPQEKKNNNPTAVSSMSYVAYFKKGANPGRRPITFLYNGGPGSATIWLHMGAFGPKRVVTGDHTHTPAAPYGLVNNKYSLLDASDLVFVDAPGTGFGRIAGKNAKKDFYGTDVDAYAFSRFIMQFLSKYNRWNSPKYLFGESYGTPRSAALINILENDDNIDFNGVILLSQILDYSDSIDLTKGNPGNDRPFELALPSYAAVAWYHHKLPGQPIAQKDLPAFLHRVAHYAMTTYAEALNRGTSLDAAEKLAVAKQLHLYTGLPVDYLMRADLRVNGGQFRHELQIADDLTTGRLDARFSGPSMDPLSEFAYYDPQSAAISSAYVAAFNSYVRDDLGYTGKIAYRPDAHNIGHWNFLHQPPGYPFKKTQALNVMPDLAAAMKANPDLHVMVNGGYFDLATVFYQGWYEMHHLSIPQSLTKNIQYHYYMSGHMVYVHVPSLKHLHKNVVAFIRSTDNVN